MKLYHLRDHLKTSTRANCPNASYVCTPSDLFHENFKRKIVKEKLKAALCMVSDDSKIKNNLVLKFVAQANSFKPWNRAEEFSEFEEQRSRKNDAVLMKEGRFGCQCNAFLKCIDILKSFTAYLEQDKKCQNEVSRLLRLSFPCPVVHYEWTNEVGYHTGPEALTN